MRRVSIRVLARRRAALLLIAAMPIARPAAAASSIQWYASLEEGSARARELNKPMMVEFWADWCVPCRIMEKEVYPTDEAVQASQPFIAVRIDFDRKPAISRKYGVSALPALVFTDSYGNDLFHYSGVLTARGFAELLSSLPHDMTEFNRLNSVIARDRNNADALEAMGRQLRTAGLFLKSNEYYARSLRQNTAKTDAGRREAILSDMGANFLDVHDGKQAATVFERCIREFPASARRSAWTESLRRARALVARKE
jgi:thioredoxin-like negative regulator of GroEL